MKVDTVVVGYDGSDNARSALGAAVDLVADQGVVHVVTAYTPASVTETGRLLKSLPQEYAGSFDVLAGPTGHLHYAERLLEEHAVRHRGHLIEDHPAAAILDVADEVDADMIIVGSRGLGWGTRFLRGSVSTRIANHAKTSFLVIHEGDD